MRKASPRCRSGSTRSTRPPPAATPSPSPRWSSSPRAEEERRAPGSPHRRHAHLPDGDPGHTPGAARGGPHRRPTRRNPRADRGNPRRHHGHDVHLRRAARLDHQGLGHGAHQRAAGRQDGRPDGPRRRHHDRLPHGDDRGIACSRLLCQIRGSMTMPDEPSGHPQVDLVFEGGGVKGIALVGAYSMLEEKGYVPHNVAGSSAGAIVAALVAAGYSAGELHDILTETKFSQFEDAGWEKHILALGAPISILKDHGIYRGKQFHDWLSTL